MHRTVLNSNFYILSCEMSLKEIPTNRSFIDFVFSVQAPWHRKRIGCISNRKAFLNGGERVEALFLEEGSDYADGVVGCY